MLPNPMVGAVVVKAGQVIGTGYHKRFGGPHAEVFALDQAGQEARGATLYVNLEPCNHYGKTPPCTEKIIRAGIERVVVAMADPNPLVNGGGIRKLREQGIQVEVGLLEAEAKRLNAAFIKFATRKLPYVSLKIAQTLDSKIADRNGCARWISGEKARARVHRWRAEAGAVLVGIGTVLKDDPRLTIRHVKGPQPWRLVLDSHLRIPLTAHLIRDEFASKTLIFTRKTELETEKAGQIRARGVKITGVDEEQEGRLSLKQVLSAAAGMNIAHIFVEGGSRIFSSFLEQKLADHLYLFLAPKFLGNGIDGFKVSDYDVKHPLTVKDMRWAKVGEDTLVEGDFDWGQ